MHHSFVSYSRSDAAWVQQLVARLERHGVRIWIDRRDIPVTVPWMDEVRDAITEADLFLCCDSPAFQSSDNCRAETDLATQAGKPQLKVAVAGDIAEAESNVLQSWRHIAPERFQRTELAVLSRDWDRAGRPRGGLVSWQVRQRLMRALQVGIPATAIEQTFLRQSRSRSLRRTAAAVTVAVVLTAGVTAYETFNQARTIISNDNSSQAAIYTTEQAGFQDVINDPTPACRGRAARRERFRGICGRARQRAARPSPRRCLHRSRPRQPLCRQPCGRRGGGRKRQRPGLGTSGDGNGYPAS